MTILITGATGLLGANLVQYYTSRKNHSVRVLMRHGSSIPIRGKYETRWGNITDYHSIDNAVHGCDVVIHAASVTSPFEERDVYDRVNVEGTRNVIRAVLKQPETKLVFVSTANTIAPGTARNPGTEVNKFSDDVAESGYVISKYMAEEHVREGIANEGLKAVIVNPTFMIGTLDLKPSSGQLVRYAMRNKWQFCPAGIKNFVPVKDVVRFIDQIIKQFIVGERYLIAGYNLSYRQFLMKVNTVARHKAVIISIPPSLIRSFGYMAYLFQKNFRIRLPLNRVNARLLSMNNFYDGSKAVRHLGITYSSLDEAIRECVEWFRDQKF